MGYNLLFDFWKWNALLQWVIFCYFQSTKWDTKEAEAVLNKFNITLTNQDLNRLHDGEELNDQVPLWTWKSKNLN